MSSELELDEGIKSIKSVWRREHTARTNLEKMLENAEAENAKLRELCAGLWDVMWACAEQRCPHRYEDCFVVSGNGGGPKGHGECWYKRRMRELGVEVD